MEYMSEARRLVGQMTLEEKASLCSGLDFWHLKGVERLGLHPVMVTDGPHGLRKQKAEADHLGINESVPATCFPPACSTANSFDPGLMREIGEAIGEECLQEQVAVVLGPGVNIKRSPLCGRNFEYISEDPFLAGKMAAGLVGGVQSKGVGVSVKHYAVNNQETRRMSINAVVDSRALREIYLRVYEIIVREAKPWTLMCSYNLVNGTYASDSEFLLKKMLRDEWNFEGLVMTDWGACNDRVQGVRAGLDLEMPSSGGTNDRRIAAAVKDGSLSEEDLDRVAANVTALILKSQEAAQPGFRYSADDHHSLARRAAAESCVLLKNERDILPLKEGTRAAVIGALAKTPRYQGSGSSKICPTRLDCAFDALTEAGFELSYADGYSLKPGAQADELMIREACDIAKDCDVALVFAGLPDEYESEGFDRESLDMPDAHNRLIERVSKANPNTVVVLQLGAPVTLPWSDRVSGILAAYLGGQAGGSGGADVLTGRVCPSGKLAESWPLALIDTPCHRYFPGASKSVEYRESIFVGYRYYDRVGRKVAYPFGYGLSYAKFLYEDLDVKPLEDGGFDVTFSITNTGAVRAAEIAQVYVGLPGSALFRPLRELKGFSKVLLEPGERADVTVRLGKDEFRVWGNDEQRWLVEDGRYRIEIGASSRDIRLKTDVEVKGDGKPGDSLQAKAPVYWNLPQQGELVIDDASFEALCGGPLPPSDRKPGEPYTVNSTLADIKDTAIGKQIISQTLESAKSMLGDDGDMARMMQAMLMDMPLRALMMMGGGQMTPLMLDGIVSMLNKKVLKGMFQMFLGRPKKAKN